MRAVTVLASPEVVMIQLRCAAALASGQLGVEMRRCFVLGAYAGSLRNAACRGFVTITRLSDNLNLRLQPPRRLAIKTRTVAWSPLNAHALSTARAPCDANFDMNHSIVRLIVADR